MKSMKKLIAVLTVLLCVAATMNAQEKPIRVGLKFGIPNIVGLNGEYVTPVLGGKLAPSLDFSYFGIGIGGTHVSLSYFELGPNFYFFKEGRGLYGNLSYGRIGASLKYEDVASQVDASLGGGSAKASIGVSRFNIKIGAKWGNTFYFRPEIGYAIASATSNVNVEVEFPDGTKESQSQEVPGFVGTSGILFNVGFGFAF